MIATTIINSMRVKPWVFFIVLSPSCAFWQKVVGGETFGHLCKQYACQLSVCRRAMWIIGRKVGFLQSRSVTGFTPSASGGAAAGRCPGKFGSCRGAGLTKLVTI